MKTIEIGSTSYRVAERWGELTPDQYRELIPCVYLPFEGTVDTLDNEAAACRSWLGMSPKKWADLKLSNWQWGQLRQQFGWLFQTRPGEGHPEGKPPITSFFHRGVNYHLPADNFTDTSAIELAFANMAYLEFAAPEAPDQSALDRLVATLCRPRRDDLKKFQRSRDWNGDIREPFTEQRMSDHAKALATLDLRDKMVILEYFERMNLTFLAQYGEIFGQGGEPRYGDGRGWIMLLKNVAKQGHFGDFDKVCSTPAHLLFATLLDDVYDQQDARDKTPTDHD